MKRCGQVKAVKVHSGEKCNDEENQSKHKNYISH